MGVDPVPFQEGSVHSFNAYMYGNNNPYKFVDPNGNSPISVFAKQAAKVGIKEGLKKMSKRQMRRLGRYMKPHQKKEFFNDVNQALGNLDSTPLEIGIEIIPVLGDIYGGVKFSKDISKAYRQMQNLENKWVQKIYDSLSTADKKKFKTVMRNAGVRDAKKDQGLAQTGSGKEMHHNTMVMKNKGRASDPRHIEALSPEEHRKWHRGNK